MSDLLLPQLIVLARGGSVAPSLFVLTILLLGSQRALLNATALVPGYFAVCATIGIVGLILFAGVVGAAGIDSTVDCTMSFISGSLLIVLGIRNLLLNTSDRAVFAARWMGSVRYITPAKRSESGWHFSRSKSRTWRCSWHV